MTKEVINTPTPAFYNNPKIRAIFYQAVVVIALIVFFYTIINNTLTNMEARGIKTGYGFLSVVAGFDILMSLIPYDATYTYGTTFIVGLLNTLLVSVISIVFATLLGFFIGLARLSPNWLAAKLATVYVEIFRNIPLLLQIFFWYFAVLAALPGIRQSLSFFGDTTFLNNRGLIVPGLIPEAGAGFVYGAIAIAIIGCMALHVWAKKRQQLTGQQFPVFWASLGLLIGLPLLTLFAAGTPFQWDIPELQRFSFDGGISLIPELMALTVALSIYTAAFIAEAVRAGVQSVPHGQIEAARSLGLREARLIKLVVIPQALRVIIPPLNSQYQNLIKNSSLATAIGYPDLVSVFMGTTLNQTGQAVEIVFMTMAVYLVINLLLSTLMNWYNNSIALVERK